jgi:hypothetical protein
MPLPIQRQRQQPKEEAPMNTTTAAATHDMQNSIVVDVIDSF